MKKIVFFALFPLFCLAGVTDSLTFDIERTYYYHLPEGYNSDTTYSLIIALHGGFGSGQQLESQSQLSKKADAGKFIVVYPDGYKNILGIRTWNGGGCCGTAMNNNIDDVGFINALLDKVMDEFSIDSNRIYATGMSNGGFMAYRLACELSHRFAAIAPVSSTMNYDCTPENPVGIIHFQSRVDSSIPYLGGIGNGVSNHYNPPLDSVHQVWTEHNNCLQTDTLPSIAELTFVQSANCACNQNVEYYLYLDGGHSWPGGQSTGLGAPVSQMVNATNVMWEYFKEHPKCSEVSSIEPIELPIIESDVVWFSVEGKRIFEIQPYQIYLEKKGNSIIKKVFIP